jgi:hypothetical protein
MVEVVAPLRVEAVPTGFPRAHETRVVQIALGDQQEPAAEVRLERLDLGRELLEEVDGGGVDDRVDGVEAEPVQGRRGSPRRPTACDGAR